MNRTDKILRTLGRGAAALVVIAAATSGPAGSAQAAQADHWHVHDGADAPVPPGFADVLGGDGDGTLSLAESVAYLLDPLRCPDATDKVLLPNGRHGSQPLRAGVCFTSVYVVHLRTVSASTPTPASWSELPGGGSSKTLYLLTALG